MRVNIFTIDNKDNVFIRFIYRRWKTSGKHMVTRGMSGVSLPQMMGRMRSQCKLVM